MGSLANLDSFDFYDDGELETPLDRVFLLFKILGINLIFGCICTIICFSVKQSVGKFLSYLLCGFCDCDCEYDGSQPSRSRHAFRQRKSQQHISRNRSRYYYENNASPCEDSLACAFWRMFKSCFSNKTLVKRVILLLVGVLVGWLLLTTREDPDLSEPVTLIHSFSNHELISMDTDNPKRVFFVTAITASGLQNAKLIRIAQALFQSRHFVTWVIVSTDPVVTPRIEHWGWNQIQKWKTDENRVLEHLDDLYETVSRFGIPFVILSGHEIHHGNLGFTKEQLSAQKSISTYVKASHVGILWVTKTFHKGVLLVGSDYDAYNFNLFLDVQGTQLMSTWPSVFDPRYRFSVSTPLLRNGTNSIKGYFIGGSVKENGIPLQYANFALNIRLSRLLRTANQLWKLTFDNKYTSRDLKIRTSKIQPLARNCSQIYVWRLGTTFTHYMVVNKPNVKIPLKLKWMETNARPIHKLIKRWFATDLNILNPK